MSSQSDRSRPSGRRGRSRVSTCWRAGLLLSLGIVSCCLTVMLSGCANAIPGAPVVHGAATGTLLATPSNVSFGTVSVGKTASTKISLVNNGSAPVQISQVNVTGPFMVIGQSGNIPFTVAAGASYTVSVQFNPVAAGTQTGQLTVSSNSSTGSTAVIALSGMGTSSASTAPPSPPTTPKVPPIGSATLSALTCSSASITGAGTDLCTITLNAPSASGGLSVNLLTNNAAVKVPSTVTVPANVTSAAFMASVTAVSSAQSATLIASAGTVSKSFTLQLNSDKGTPPPAGTLSALTCSNASLTGAGTELCAVALSAPAASGGLNIGLSSNNPAVILPAAVTVPANATSAAFSATVKAVTSTQTATLSANAGGVWRSYAVQLKSDKTPSPAGTLSALTCSNASLTGAGTELCAVALSAPAASGGLNVGLSSNDATVTVPAAVIVPAGASSAGFSATVKAVASTQTATLSANAGGVWRSYAVRLNAPAPAATLSALTCSNASMTGTGTELCTVALSGPAASGGLSVGLSSSDPAVTLPAVVTVPANASSAGFSAAVKAVTSTQTATLSANAGGVWRSYAVQLSAPKPVGALSALSCSTGSITGAGTESCTVALSGPAPGGGLTVGLSSSNAAVTVPAAVMVPPNAASAAFTAAVKAVTSTQTATLTANASGTSRSYPVQLNAPTPVGTLSALTCSSGSITGAGTELCTVSLSGPAASGGLTVGLSSSNAAITLPAAITVPANASSAAFSAAVKAVTSTQTATLTANAGGVSRSYAVQLTAPAPVGTLSALTCSQASMTGAGTELCTVALSGPAASGGLTVGLSSSNAAITLPAAVTVPANASSAAFSAAVKAVTSTQTATLIANASGVSRSYAVQLNAPTPTATLNSLSCNNASLTGAGTELCTVALSGPAASSGLTVGLSSSDAAITLPAAVTVPANASSTAFSAAVKAVTSTQTATLTANAGGVSRSYAVQLNAPSVGTLTIDATSVGFGTVNLNTTATQSVTLTSTGGAAVTVNSATVTGTGFTLSGGSYSGTLNPGQSVTLVLEFDPTTTGPETGQLTVSSNSSTGSTAVIGLNGTGQTVAHEVDLNWDAPSSSPDPVAGYNIYRAPGGSSSYGLLKSGNTTTNYTDNSVQSGQTYDYIVKSVDDSGVESPASNMAGATVP